VAVFFTQVLSDEALYFLFSDKVREHSGFGFASRFLFYKADESYAAADAASRCAPKVSISGMDSLAVAEVAGGRRSQRPCLTALGL